MKYWCRLSARRGHLMARHVRREVSRLACAHASEWTTGQRRPLKQVLSPTKKPQAGIRTWGFRSRCLNLGFFWPDGRDSRGTRNRPGGPASVQLTKRVQGSTVRLLPLGAGQCRPRPPRARPRRTRQAPTRCRFSLRCRQADFDDLLARPPVGRWSPASGG